jgi:ATP-binding protein involved in chromosome partitioning
MTDETLRNALKQVRYPGFSRDIVSFGLVRDIRFEAGTATVLLSLTTADENVPRQLKADCEQALLAVPGVERAQVNVSLQAPKKTAAAPQHKDPAAALPGVKAVIAVASGKGGVGKSTFAVNLACALDRLLSTRGPHDGVGILDCDIYGPSVPLMMGVSDRPEIADNRIYPEHNYGIRVMSMGLLTDDDSPVVWRGPMVTNAIIQFIHNVEWGRLEILVVDLPPGTGDAQLALVQTIPVKGAVIVTTPQAAAVTSHAAARACLTSQVPLLGVAENMSYLIEADGTQNPIFGSGGGGTSREGPRNRPPGENPPRSPHPRGRRPRHPHRAFRTRRHFSPRIPQSG